MRPEDLEIKTIPAPSYKLGALDRRAGGTGAVGMALRWSEVTDRGVGKGLNRADPPTLASVSPETKIRFGCRCRGRGRGVPTEYCKLTARASRRSCILGFIVYAVYGLASQLPGLCHCLLPPTPSCSSGLPPARCATTRPPTQPTIDALRARLAGTPRDSVTATYRCTCIVHAAER